MKKQRKKLSKVKALEADIAALRIEVEVLKQKADATEMYQHLTRASNEYWEKMQSMAWPSLPVTCKAPEYSPTYATHKVCH